MHPQSIVHSLVHLNDGASLAHLGYPDMKVPISYALHLPERADVDVPTLDLAEVGSLEFEPPDTDTFPCLRLAREAGEVGGTAPVRAERLRRGRRRGLPRGPHPVHRHRRGDRPLPGRGADGLCRATSSSCSRPTAAAREHARGLIEGLAVS